MEVSRGERIPLAASRGEPHFTAWPSRIDLARLDICGGTATPGTSGPKPLWGQFAGQGAPPPFGAPFTVTLVRYFFNTTMSSK